MAISDQHQTVFLTGATGAMGLAIARALTQAGHEVLGVTRSEQGVAELRSLGATPVMVDLFDPEALRQAMRGVDTIAHFATKIPEGMAAAKRANWAMNDRLRTEATRNLIAAAEANGVRRFIFESFFGAYPDNGDDWIEESLPLQPVARILDSLVEGETLVNDFGAQGGEAVNLRFAAIYGPGRASNALIEMVRKRRLPIIGTGHNYLSAIHVDDVGSAVLHALTVAPGSYNVSDDEPMRQSDLNRLIAASLHAPAPRRIPYFLVRLLMGGVANVVTGSRRLSNRRFREAAGWRPRYPTAIEGWQAFAGPDAATADLTTPVGAR